MSTFHESASDKKEGTMGDWKRIVGKCDASNRLSPPFGRSIHLIDNKYVCKLTTGEVDEKEHWYVPKESMPKVDDVLARDKNEVTILQQIKGIAPVPRVYYYESGVIIQEYIHGESLMDIWNTLSVEEINSIKHEVVAVMKQLSKIDVETIAINLDKRYDNAFEGETMFMHSDLNPSNILVNGKKLAGIIDWEYAGYYNIQTMSDINKDMCHRGRSIGLDTWANLYDLITQ